MKLLKLTLVLLVLTAFTYPLIPSMPEPYHPKLHQCTWEDCDMVGHTTYNNPWGCTPDTDCYLVGLTHFEHPNWSYEECETFVFGDASGLEP